MAKLSLDDLLTWMMLVERMKAWYRGAKATPVGEETVVPETIVEIGRQRWRIPEHRAIRER